MNHCLKSREIPLQLAGAPVGLTAGVVSFCFQTLEADGARPTTLSSGAAEARVAP